MRIRFTIHGARGSTPVAHPTARRFGGETTCCSLQLGDERILLFDAGTGIRRVAADLGLGRDVPPIALFFTHFHLDHVLGLALWPLRFQAGTDLLLLGSHTVAPNWPESLARLFREPYWPAPLEGLGARVRYADLPGEGVSTDFPPARIRWHRVQHPQGCIAYRIDVAGRGIVFATDVEHGPAPDDSFVAFCRGADVLIHDAQYTLAEYETCRGRGHSTWQSAADMARQAGVARLVFTHHDVDRSDDELDSLVGDARKVFPATEAAYDGMTVLEIEA